MSDDGYETPKWVFLSTPESVRGNIVSVVATAETLVAVPLYWWIAIYFGTYGPLLMSAVAAPLVLLNSDLSEELRIRWLTQWEQLRWEDKRPYDSLNQSDSLRAAIIIGFAGFLSFAVTQVLTVGLVGAAEGWTAMFLGAAVGWLSLASVVVAIGALATAMIGAGALAECVTRSLMPTVIGAGLGAAYSSGVIAAAGTMFGAVFSIVLAPLAVFVVRTPSSESRSLVIDAAATAISMLCMPLTVGTMLGLTMVRINLHIMSISRHISAGIRALSNNFYRLVFCTSLIQPPEPLLVRQAAGAPPSNFEVVGNLASQTQSLGPTERILSTILFMPLFGIFIILPTFLFRISLKSTAWIWWPLAYLSGRALTSRDARYFLDYRLRSPRAIISLISSAMLLVLFVIVNTNAQIIVPLPLRYVFESMLSVQWGRVPWQVLLVGFSMLTIVIHFLTVAFSHDYNYATERADRAALKGVESRLAALESLVRLRALLVLLFWLLASAHAVLYLNSLRCWVSLPPNVENWARWIFEDFLPRANCSPG